MQCSELQGVGRESQKVVDNRSCALEMEKNCPVKQHAPKKCFSFCLKKLQAVRPHHFDVGVCVRRQAPNTKKIGNKT
jgi:hypothetical protein